MCVCVCVCVYVCISDHKSYMKALVPVGDWWAGLARSCDPLNSFSLDLSMMAESGRDGVWSVDVASSRDSLVYLKAE